MRTSVSTQGALAEGSSALAAGLGALTFAFFPLAIPLVALTAVALIPFVAVGLVLGIIAAPPILAVRWLRARRGTAAPPPERRRRLHVAPEAAR